MMLLQQRSILMQEIETVNKVRSARPKPSQYSQLHQDFTHFQTHMVNPTSLTELLRDAKRELNIDTNSHGMQHQFCFNKLTAVTRSCDQFIAKMMKSYLCYQDITLLPLSALQKIRYGLQTCQEVLSHAQLRHQFLIKLPPTCSEKIEPSQMLRDIMSCLTESCSPMEYITRLCSNNLLSCAGSLTDFYPDIMRPVTRTSILMLAMKYLKRIHSTVGRSIKHSKQTVGSWWYYMDQILSFLHVNWLQMKQREKEEEEERQSLFKYKSQTHCENQTEEEELAAMQQALFPSFEDSLSDLVQEDTMGDEEKGSEKMDKQVQESLHSSNAVRKVDRIDERTVYQLVKELLLPSGEVKDTFHREVSLEIYQMASSLWTLPQLYTDISSPTCPPLHLIALTNLKKNIVKEEVVDVESFDIYQHPHFYEAIQTRQILNRYLDRVKEVLLQFEEHPALLQISLVIERILSFAVNSPLMKILTGLEFLLRQSQEWESYAASHVSFKSHLEEITKKVIEFRKIELRCWPNLLAKSERNTAQSVSRWWFQFYNILSQITEESSNRSSVIDELVIAVKQFLELSSLGEYSARLELIYVLTKYMQHNQTVKDVSVYVENLFHYYSQFEQDVKQHLNKERGVIEKELKDYVKIAKWNDINFYAVKQAVEKSHRTISKFIKRYKEVLDSSARGLLQDTKLIKARTETNQLVFTASITFSAVIQDILIDPILFDVENSLLSKTDKLNKKIAKHCTNVQELVNFGQLIEALDEFTGDVISEVKALQSVDVLSLPKEKQKEARNNLQQRKRLALSNLFKELKAMGLSYRKGMSSLQSQDGNETLKQPVLNAEIFQSDDVALGERVRSTLESGNGYYYKCLARQNGFHLAMCSPSKELSPTDLKRCQGITHNLLDMLITQRQQLHHLLTNHSDISYTLKLLEGLTSSPSTLMDSLPPQDDARDWTSNLSTSLHNVEHVLSNFQLVIESCPTSTPDDMMTPDIPSNLPPASRCCLTDDIIQTSLQQIKMVINNAQKARKEMAPNQDLVNWSDAEKINETMANVKNICKDLDSIVQPYLDPREPSSLSLATPLVSLRGKLNELCNQYSLSSLYQSYNTRKMGFVKPSVKAESLINNVEEVIKQVLLALQIVVKETVVMKEEIASKQDSTEILSLDGLISPIFEKRLFQQVQSLSCDTINSKLKSIVHSIHECYQSVEGCRASGSTYKVLMNAVPLLHHFKLLLQYFLHHVVLLHRTTCKLQFVLLGLFTDFVTQGFCIPPEEDSSTAGEGATEFEDIQGGGLGPGEGAKDVSDQIESEDQLEDTKQAGEKDEQEEDNEPDVKEEKEGVEMSDDFEGKLQDLDIDEADDSNSEDDDDEGGKDEKDEQKGSGAEGKRESEIVAKDENEGEQEGDEKDEKNNNEGTEEIHEMEETEEDVREDEDDEEGGKDKPESKIEDMQEEAFPEDMQIDGEEKEEEGEDDADEPASEENGKIEEEIDEVEEKEEENEEEEGGEMKTEEFQPDNDEEARDEQQKEKAEGDEEEENSEKREEVPQETEGRAEQADTPY